MPAPKEVPKEVPMEEDNPDNAVAEDQELEKRLSQLKPSYFGSQWVSGKATTWVLYEHILGFKGPEFTIYDGVSGEATLKCSSGFFGTEEYLYINDLLTGEEVAVVTRLPRTNPPVWVINQNHHTIATLRKEANLVSQWIRVYKGAASFNILTGGTYAEILYSMYGEFWSKRNTNIYVGDTNEKAAFAHNKRLHWSGLFGKDQYVIQVEAGEDILLLLLCMLVKDEMETGEAKQAKQEKQKKDQETVWRKQQQEGK